MGPRWWRESRNGGAGEVKWCGLPIYPLSLYRRIVWSQLYAAATTMHIVCIDIVINVNVDKVRSAGSFWIHVFAWTTRRLGDNVSSLHLPLVLCPSLLDLAPCSRRESGSNNLFDKCWAPERGPGGAPSRACCTASYLRLGVSFVLGSTF